MKLKRNIHIHTYNKPIQPDVNSIHTINKSNPDIQTHTINKSNPDIQTHTINKSNPDIQTHTINKSNPDIQTRIVDKPNKPNIQTQKNTLTWVEHITIIHVIAPYNGNGELQTRQQHFLNSVENAYQKYVTLIACTNETWSNFKWKNKPLKRDTTQLGDTKQKPYLKDLLDTASNEANGNDWLLLTNIDCIIAKNTYETLHNTTGTVIEYMRRDINKKIQHYTDAYSLPNKLFTIGIDGIAIKAQYYNDIKHLIPDCIIGEPHWDTILHGMFRKLIPTIMITNQLYHPTHTLQWGHKEKSHGEKHNETLYQDAKTYGLIDKPEITKEPNQTDTAIIIVFFGNDKTRWESTLHAFNQQTKQDLYTDFYFVELTINDETSHYPPELLKKINHVLIHGTQKSQDLWQKECLMNHGWKHALQKKPYKYILFIDSDIYSKQYNWFRTMRDHLIENPQCAIQGFRTVEDTKDIQLNFNSLASTILSNYQTDLPINPGMCWAISSELLIQNNGLNPYFIDGGGDSGFVAEYLNTEQNQYDICQQEFKWFHEIIRNIKNKATINYVPIDIIHVNHGMYENKNYHNIRIAMNYFNRPLLKIIKLNNGLLEWIDPNCTERKIMKQRPQMTTIDNIIQIMNQHNYKGEF